ncbi:MAG TPA: FkbM family methyltransferase [Polyangia bacterium]|nr:FkbM family methyltransferase [Polyangia bacterium]
MKKLLSPGDVFVDGGANIGLFTLAAAAQVGATGKVVSFEPAREVRMRLTQNVALNRLSQVQIVPFALSSGPGEAAFRSFEIAGAGLNHLAPSEGESGTVESVTLTTLDAVLGPTDRRRLALVKLDLEGAEHAALLGAAEILQQVRPHLIIEIEDEHLRRLGSSAAQVLALLEGLGYRFFQAHRPSTDQIALSPFGGLVHARSGPNVFATTDLARVQARGVRID